jgi:hypothetical protein
LTEELVAEAALGEEVARKLLGELAYRSEDLREALAEVGILLASERSYRALGTAAWGEAAHIIMYNTSHAVHYAHTRMGYQLLLPQ